MTTPNYPYVKFSALWTTNKDGNQVPDTQEVNFNVSSIHNASEEAIRTLRKKGWKVLGYGNFPKNQHYIDFADSLDKLTDIAIEKEVEARVQARLRSENKTKLEEEVKRGKAKNEQI